jgi:ABC-2 type transport system permease protein
MKTWARVFMEDIPWIVIIRNYTVLAGISLSLFALGAVVFHNRDVKS